MDRGAGACRHRRRCCWSPACLQIARLARWAGDRTFADRLVLVLHVGYAFVPLGFLLIGTSAFTAAVPASAGIHAWTAGAIGLMTLAVMTRATLGHTGQPLQAGAATQAIYALRAGRRAVAHCRRRSCGSMMLLEAARHRLDRRLCRFVLVYGPLLALRKPAWAEARLLSSRRLDRPDVLRRRPGAPRRKRRSRP